MICKFCSTAATTEYGTCETHITNDKQYFIDHADGSGLKSYFPKLNRFEASEDGKYSNRGPSVYHPEEDSRNR